MYAVCEHRKLTVFRYQLSEICVVCQPASQDKTNKGSQEEMTLYWIQYFIIFIAMDVYIFVYTFECILRNPLTTFHQLCSYRVSLFFLFSFAENCMMSIFVYSLAKGKNGFHSFWHGCIYSHDDDDDGDDDITHTYMYLPICSIDTSRKKRYQEIGNDSSECVSEGGQMKMIQRITERK